MASNSPEPSSSTETHQHVAEEILSREVRTFCDVSYSDENNIEFQGENFVSHFKTENGLAPVVSYGQFSIDPCSSSGTYVQILHTHASDAVPSTAASPSSANILLHEDSVDSRHSQVQEAEDELGRVSLSVDHLNLQHVSIVQPGFSNLNILLDRNSLAALIASSRTDAAFALDVSNLPRSILPSQGIAPRADPSQFLSSDGSIPNISHNILPSILSQKDIITSMIASSSTSTSSNSVGNTFPINHKQMLAQKYAAEMLSPTTSANLISDHQIIESISDRTTSPYVVTATAANSLIDSTGIAVYDDHSVSAPTSVSQCLPLDVYAIDRTALVSSSRDSPENVINGSVEFENVASNSSSHHSVQNFVSSSVDLVHSHSLEHGIHCTVDSTVGPKLHQNDENVVDSSDGYNQALESSADNVLHTTTGEYCHISDMNSCEDSTTNEAVTSVLSSSSGLEANEALSTTSHRFSSHNQFSADIRNSVDELHSCATVSSATHPDSTRSPEELSENSSSYSVPSNAITDSTDIVQSEYSRPRRDLRSNRHWCEDCGTFYDKECTQHRIQLIFDKPVLSRAWASLPASYLYVNKIFQSSDGEPVYGVFAKKTIPKRTQFGPIEGILVKREDPPNEKIFYMVDDNGVTLYMDTSDESISNWMRFVRPATTHKEQNLVLVQQGQNLYFNTIRSINPKTELRIWYSPAYAEKFGLPVLEPNEEEKKVLEQQQNSWSCFECHQNFPTSEDLQKHLNQHDGEDRNGPKTRSKSKTKIKKGQFNRLRPPETPQEGSEGIFIRKARGRPPKKYKIPPKQEDYKCDICNKSFPRNYSLQRHSIMHTGEKKFKCPICDLRFSHVYNRNRHVRKHKRDDDGPQVVKPAKSLFKKKQGAEWVCTHCGLTFDNSSVLNLHTLTHAAEDVGFNEAHPYLENSTGNEDGFDGSDESKLGGEEMHKCPECTQEFPNRRDLIEHASVHGKILKQRCYRGIINPLKPYKCNLCYKSFASDDRLIKHYLVHGSEDSKPLQCDVCYKRFLNNSALACHVKVHSEERKFYECPICKAEFDQIVALKEHVHVHNEDGVYKCPSCVKVFEEYNQIRKHIRAFHSERRYPCDKCEKIFPRPDKLKLHMLRHSDHREFLCQNCGKQFKRKDKLKEHMKRMHAPDREAKVNAKNSSKSGTKKFVPKVSPTDYHRFIYKCHTCLLGFKRRGMLVNHLAKRHPDIRPESVPELNLPILKTTRDYYCQYCEKVYKSSSKRKAHILKNHPGAELPMSNRKKGGIPEIPGVPNPTFSQTVGSITTHPHHCNWCHKQYASKAKLLQHQRKKHLDMLSLSYVANNTKVEPVCDQGTQVNGQIVIENVPSNLSNEAAAVLIDATKRKIQFIDKDSLVISTHPDGLPTADLLTQAMSELTQNLDYKNSGEFLSARLTHSTPATLVTSPSSTPIQNPSSPNDTSPDSPPAVLDTTITASLDPLQINQLIAQYQQQQQLSPSQVQQLAVVVTPVPRTWPPAVTTSLSNYPAR